MPYVKVNCTSCGGEIQLDSNKESGFCLHCGTRVIFQEAIQKVELINLPKIESLLQLADIAYEDENYHEAYEYYKKILEINPDNYRASIRKCILDDNNLDIETYIKVATKLIHRLETLPMKNQGEINKGKVELADKWDVEEFFQLMKELYLSAGKEFISEVEIELFRKSMRKCINYGEFIISLYKDIPESKELLIKSYQNLPKYITTLLEPRTYETHDNKFRRISIQSELGIEEKRILHEKLTTIQNEYRNLI